MLESEQDVAISRGNHRAQIESKSLVMRNWQWLLACLAVAVAGAVAAPRANGAGGEPRPYGLTQRIAPQPYLKMPHRADGNIPSLLSQTGAFSDTRNLIPSKGLIPYDLVVAFWSDGASKLRWAAVPRGKIKYSPTGEWIFPKGTVFVKTFELPTDGTDPGTMRRLETRLLVCDEAGGVYGAVYRWRADHSDADLLATSRTEAIPIKTATGETHSQTWYYPSRADCLACHNAKTSGVLGPKARQLNRMFTYPSGVTDNQLRAWNHIGLFAPAVDEAQLASLPTLAAADDTSRTLQDRARSYLDANCAQCHRPGGTVAYFDARYDTPLDKQELIDGPILIDQGIDKPRVISPHDIWRSIVFMRVNTLDDIKMPPIARETIDTKGVQLLRDWINSLPGRAVLDPPTMSPDGGSFPGPIAITLSAKEPGADIRYTLDGSTPGPSDTRYERPINLTSPSVLRARAYKDGFTRSITVQEVFIVGK
ncbi:MAG: chitobiase/beta-hexosaminidase C-terminal domain-containing protein [Gammaproteobacteria bacterium]